MSLDFYIGYWSYFLGKVQQRKKSYEKIVSKFKFSLYINIIMLRCDSALDVGKQVYYLKHTVGSKEFHTQRYLKFFSCISGIMSQSILNS